VHNLLDVFDVTEPS